MARRKGRSRASPPAHPTDGRSDRRYETEGDEGFRSPFERDRDSILYTNAFRRLAGVTQVVGPAEGQIFHNRLTHTLEVAQIAQRLAEHLARAQPDQADRNGGLDPSVVEAAALAHDLGHPPFGHIAEKTLNKLVARTGQIDGYEGNAQSFRIITRLSIRRDDSPGLNLARATLDATLKYPVIQEADIKGTQKLGKWGAYSTERDDFNFARASHASGDRLKSLEAEIMDWADDIAYSIHDTEDFYRAGLIPLDRFATNTDAVDNFLATTFERWEHEKIEMRFARTDLEQSFRELCEALPITEPYTGTNSQRAALRTVTSNFIGRYVRSTRIGEALQNESLLAREDEHQMQIIMLKELTWQFVINSSALASQQCGQQKAISTLFRIFMDTVTTNNPARWARLPARNREDMEKLYEHYGMGIPESERIRVVADAIAGMTDQQAMLMYHRLMGITSGSSFDAVIL